jgi:hypothetical protein
MIGIDLILAFSPSPAWQQKYYAVNVIGLAAATLPFGGSRRYMVTWR